MRGCSSKQKLQRTDPCTRAMTSRRFAIVEVEHPTESLVPADNPNFLYRARHRPDQPIVQPLMISLPAVMVHVFGHALTSRSPAMDFGLASKAMVVMPASAIAPAKLLTT